LKRSLIPQNCRCEGRSGEAIRAVAAVLSGWSSI
jgi:hypothetical protein